MSTVRLRHLRRDCIKMLNKTKKYINDKLYKIKPVWLEYVKSRGLVTKIQTLLWQIAAICFTGIIIAYIVKNYRDWLRYGLIAFIIEYYIFKLITKIKEKN